MAKQSSAKSRRMDQAGSPTASRPIVPSDYGMPQATEGLLPWSHVTQRMVSVHYYWLSTVSVTGQPYATPVEGLWIDQMLYFGGSPHTRWSQNLAENPSICLHLESAIDVVILRGKAVAIQRLEREVAERLAQVSHEKYGYGSHPDAYEHPQGMYAFRPHTVLAWTAFPKDVTKWEL